MKYGVHFLVGIYLRSLPMVIPDTFMEHLHIRTPTLSVLQFHVLFPKSDLIFTTLIQLQYKLKEVLQSLSSNLSLDFETKNLRQFQSKALNNTNENFKNILMYQ